MRAALIHGGFWRVPYGPDLMEPLADDLAGRGWSVSNISYRRVGEPGGGWPGTLDDVREAATAASPDVVIGHSAGGHLALWVAQFCPGLRTAVSLAGVVDLYACHELGLSNGAVVELLGGTPDEVPDRYAAASPRPVDGVRLVLVHGAADDTVPVEMSTSFVGGEAVVVPGEGHMDVIDPASRSWAEARARL